MLQPWCPRVRKYPRRGPTGMMMTELSVGASAVQTEMAADETGWIGSMSMPNATDMGRGTATTMTVIAAMNVVDTTIETSAAIGTRATGKDATVMILPTIATIAQGEIRVGQTIVTATSTIVIGILTETSGTEITVFVAGETSETFVAVMSEIESWTKGEGAMMTETIAGRETIDGEMHLWKTWSVSSPSQRELDLPVKGRILACDPLAACTMSVARESAQLLVTVTLRPCRLAHHLEACTRSTDTKAGTICIAIGMAAMAMMENDWQSQGGWKSLSEQRPLDRLKLPKGRPLSRSWTECWLRRRKSKPARERRRMTKQLANTIPWLRMKQRLEEVRLWRDRHQALSRSLKMKQYAEGSAASWWEANKKPMLSETQ
mmetsp:Transcript_10293/g.37915  ORF Transcript_10293/g.37915 Transcript_10293/m.37915 type:complete len:376 (-) Transcript_10293:5285-6412(-)